MRASSSEMREETLAVLKFGGSCFSTAESYGHVASYLASRILEGQKLCVVVSAMSGTTGRLSELLGSITTSPSPEDQDAVLGTGEILAAALVRAALTTRGIKATSLNAFQLGWSATDAFTRGELSAFPGDMILSALQVSQVVVVSGGQAVTRENRLVMLGRNSSDLTAVAAAIALGCSSASLFSDVEGVFTADPYRISNTRLIPKLSYSLAKAYSRAGAKVLYPTCVDLAESHNVVIRCASLKKHSVSYGTEIGEYGQGIQVCLPSHFGIVKNNGCTESGDKNGEQIPVINHPGYDAVDLSDPSHKHVLFNKLILSEELQPIICFRFDGSVVAYATGELAKLPFAQSIHDALVTEYRLPGTPASLYKQRGTHSGVFNFDKRCLS
jgi:uridylate kinase